VTDDHAAWLEERRKSIGASDVAAADNGIYGGGTKVVASKLGLDTGDSIDPALADRGHRWEQPIADGVLAHFGLYVHGEQMLVRPPDHPNHHTTLDGMLSPLAEAGLDDITANFEVKTRGPHAPWQRGYYRSQAQFGMHCTGLARCLLAVATVDTDYDPATGLLVDRLCSVHYEWIERDESDIARLVDLADWLWSGVERGELPPAADAEALPFVKIAHAAANPKATADIDDLAALIARREQVKAAVKAAEDEAATIEAQIRQRMGEATEATTTDGRWRIRIGTPVRKFTARSETDFLDIYGDRAAELGLLRSSLDRDRAKELMPDEYDALRVPTPDRRMTVKNLRPEETP